ncbi:hypothetical protein [Natronosalvus caseinilyticus]|uniref:hypothetical protein n=1 Tax=Natronosalvus caseinilyticus TaxID=2953747 RepID=UPI0028A729D5|nr:hypothetical protein [Natronosalvus caseinilyticus]
MVGLLGTVGRLSRETTEPEDVLEWRGDEATTSYTDGRVSVTAVSHPLEAEPQPAWTDGGNVAIWLWGPVWGFETPGGEYRLPDDTAAAYCSTLYEEFGLTFVSGLNGNFAGLVYDQRADEVTFFTDRLGTHPLYVIKVDDGIVFSSDIQQLETHPAVDVEFDLEYLAEYFSL